MNKPNSNITEIYQEATNPTPTIEEQAELQRKQQEFQTKLQAALSRDEKWRDYTEVKEVLNLTGAIINSLSENITGFEKEEDLRAKVCMLKAYQRMGKILAGPNQFRTLADAEENK